MNNNSKEKFSFNFIDFIIVALLTVCVCAFVYSAVFKNDVMELLSEKYDIIYTVSTDSGIVFNENEDLFFTKNSGSAGKVISSSTVDGITTVSILAHAYDVGDGTFVKGNLLRPGEGFDIRLSDGSVASVQCETIITRDE